MFGPPHNLLELEITKVKSFVGSLFNKTKHQTPFGTQFSYSTADRIHFYFPMNNKLANEIQHLLLEGKRDKEILFNIANLFVNKELSFLSKDHLFQQMSAVMTALFTKCALLFPNDCFQVNFDTKTENISLVFADLIFLLKPSSIVLLIIIFTYLVEELHLPEVYPMNDQKIEALLQNCDQIIPGNYWRREGFIFKLLSRLGFEIQVRSQTKKKEEIISYVLYAFISNYQDFLTYKDDFAIDRWNPILNDFYLDKQTFFLNKQTFLNRINKITPIFSSEDYKGLRIIFGRARNTGFGTVGLNPVTMLLLENLKPGDQIKVNLPTKNLFSVQPVETINGPFVKLHSKSCVRINDYNTYKRLKSDINYILQPGDVLIDFFDLPFDFQKEYAGVSRKDWVQQIFMEISHFNKADQHSVLNLLGFEGENAIEQLYLNEIHSSIFLDISSELTIKLFKMFNLPIHPNWTPKWSNIKNQEWRLFRQWILKTRYNEVRDEVTSTNFMWIEGNYRPDIESFLEKSEIDFFVEKNRLVIKNWGYILFYIFLDKTANLGTIEPQESSFNPNIFLNKTQRIKFLIESNIRLKFALNNVCRSNLGNLSKEYHGYYPEPNSDFEKEIILKSIRSLNLDIKITDVSFLDHNFYSKDIKMVPEKIEKVLLRKKHNLSLNKDGLNHFSCINSPLSSFIPKEISISVETVKKLGYTFDIYGKKIVNDEQEIAILPFDIIVSRELIPSIIRVIDFLNDEIKFIYNEQSPYANIKEEKDLIGILVISLNKNLSISLFGRIIGFSNVEGCCFASPFWHLSKGSFCNGELTDSFVLDLDCFLNLNLEHLPSKSGILRGVPIFTQIKTNSIYIREELDNMYNSNPHSMQLQLISNLNFDNNYLSINSSENIKDIGSFRIENKFNQLPSKIDKIDKIVTNKSLSKLNYDQSILNLFIQKFLLKPIISRLDSDVGFQYQCASCNCVYEIPLLDSCMNCKTGKIVSITQNDFLIQEFNSIISLIETFQDEIDSKNREFVQYLKVKLLS